ncbi:MAG: hypothetical protein ABI193_11740 [Minicystis sp.]
MRAGLFAPGLLVIALGALPLACGVPFTSSTDTTGASSGGGTSSTATTTTVGVTTGSVGGAGGQKGDCLAPTDCPGNDTVCKTRTCTAGICGFDMPMAPTASQIWGDCKAQACDGQGNLEILSFPMDHYDDGNACTADTCKGQVPENKPVSGIVCANGVCNDVGSCVQCNANDMCPALKKNCVEGRCLPLHCVDNIFDAGETDKDCGGGECLPCGDGKVCGAGPDCASNVCKAGFCKAPSCGDTVKNGTETDIDCGGKCASQNMRCGSGHHCVAPNDCGSGVCQAGFCQQPICTDGVKNGNETDIDCGGNCGPCLPAN